jgi:RHH-type transcriptional regulator, proline utilization regulon repressor / proline dehydrogenase / delta 1-pyrroline-5-carboxylate dehydrogenase
MTQITPAEVIDWAKDFLDKSEKEITAEERKEQQKYAVLIQNPTDKTLLSKMLDESSQIRDNWKLARRIKLLINLYGVPAFFSKSDAFLLRMFTAFGYWFDFVAVPIFKQRLRSDTAKVIINEKASFLNRHLGERRKQQIGQNVNLLGEVVLGDAEAEHRFEHYLEALKDPRINYISVKISGIYARIHPLNHDQNKTDLCDRLSRIYRQAMAFPYTDEQGNTHSKFVNLDMEEYKDAELTLEVFKAVLSLPEFKQYRAGIVVQAYLPDAWNLQTELLLFAKRRVAEGGAPLKMRLVKGANLQMESIVSSLKGWEVPVLPSKVEVDANYLHLLDRALEPENVSALNLGVASHNFFSIGYAYLLSLKYGVEDYITFEMLEGMANHLPRVMRNLQKQIILYTPVVSDEHFLNAISYLVRRMDENTGKDNFLSYSFNLQYDSEAWHFLQAQFEKAYSLKNNMMARTFRRQDRNHVTLFDGTVPEAFRNEPDTDFDLKANKKWANGIRKHWKKKANTRPIPIPVQIADTKFETKNKHPYFDHSQAEETVIYEASLADLSQVRKMISAAEKDASGWRKTSLEERNRILHKVAVNLSNQRGKLIGCMAAVTGKTFGEGDVEVSEAIDFCRFYPTSMKTFHELNTIACTPKGIVLVIPPWNFPLAIPVGGVVAALSGGNTIILKPATVALPVAWEFAQCFWDAGVPKDALQVVCTAGREPLNFLTSHPLIRHIILTGGTDTAFRLLENNPTCPLSAETGGKNAIILTASGDRDHAIQNIVTSAFSNAGQKCSACSLLLVEKSVYNDPDFQAKLKDAVTSIQTGSVWEGGTVVGPMITNDNEKLLHAVEHLEPGESWLVEPKFVDERRFILKPCVKWGVKPGSFTFCNELFAPLLAVVPIRNLKHGVQLVNSGEYGLTSGLQSLDEAEIKYWKEHVEAGNLYINRGITGAIVNRQPFGGMKRSAFGGGIKAGGPNYVSCFVKIEEKPVASQKTTDNVESGSTLQDKQSLHPGQSLQERCASQLSGKDLQRFETARISYEAWWDKEFSKEEDSHQLMGEQNTFRYLPLKSMCFRIQPADSYVDILLVLTAAKRSGTPLKISIDSADKKLETLRHCIGKDFPLVVQSEEGFLSDLGRYERIRTCSGSLSEAFYRKMAILGKYTATAKPVVEGRIELLHYLKEQSISYEYHRYGSISEQTA